jgi:hypothetical protein
MPMKFVMLAVVTYVNCIAYVPMPPAKAGKSE